jgi:hypothetical protein
MAPACTLGGLLVRPCVELVYLAITAKPADRRTALFERDEAAIGAAAASTPVNRAPFIGVGRGGRTKPNAEGNNDDNGYNKSAKHNTLQVASELVTLYSTLTI